eukprot:jgi/Chlat1/9007/Chrsp94S08286
MRNGPPMPAMVAAASSGHRATSSAQQATLDFSFEGRVARAFGPLEPSSSAEVRDEHASPPPWVIDQNPAPSVPGAPISDALSPEGPQNQDQDQDQAEEQLEAEAADTRLTNPEDIRRRQAFDLEDDMDEYDMVAHGGNEDYIGKMLTDESRRHLQEMGFMWNRPVLAAGASTSGQEAPLPADFNELKNRPRDSRADHAAAASRLEEDRRNAGRAGLIGHTVRQLGVPDHVQHPQRYTHYTLDWTEGDEERANESAAREALHAARAAKNQSMDMDMDSGGAAADDTAPAEHQRVQSLTPVAFGHRESSMPVKPESTLMTARFRDEPEEVDPQRQAEDVQSDQSTHAAEHVGFKPQTTARTRGRQYRSRGSGAAGEEEG